jgi:DNA-binding beta-propeller fold protein YncE
MTDLILAPVKENVSLTAIDADTGKIAAVVTVGEVGTVKPHEVTLSADRTKAFVSLYGSADYGPNNVPANRLAVVDVIGMTLLGHVDLNLYAGPHALYTDNDGKIWVTVDPNQCVLVIDPDSWEIERSIWLQTPGHFSSASPDGERIYFGAKQYPVVTEVDVATKAISARISVPVGAQALRVSPDGSRLYVGDFHRPLLHVIDCSARNVIETVPLTGVPGWPFNSTDGKYVIVTTYDEPADRGYVEILDTDNLSRRRVVEVPAEPFHMLAERDGEHILVALANGQVVEIDLNDAAITNGGFHVGGSMPEALIYRDA